MRGLEGRRALVSGAGRGIGRGIAARLVAEGVSVVVNDLDVDAAEDAVAELTADGGRAVAGGGSVADPAACDALVALAEEAFGGLDILVNNAGLTRDRMLHRMSDEEWDLVVDVCLRGTFNLCRAAARLLRVPRGETPAHHRKVVNIASVNGLYGIAGNSNYSAAKAGVIGLTKALAREWAPQRINVNAIAPGFIQGTRLTAPREEGDPFGIPADQLDRILAQMPLGRPGTPEDVAGVTAFLCSTDADWMTGQVLELSGGLEQIHLT
ncbi:MAG TPA: 3-oxoacyl-ACP reductase family protein [Egibacteraceae bacterium]